MSNHQYYQRKFNNKNDLAQLKKERAMEIFAYDSDASNNMIAERLQTSNSTIVKWREEFNNVQSK